MVEIECWMSDLAERLKACFGPRLLFLGLQGSYGRGEATPESDIDVVTILDKAELPDLDAYRIAMSQMPEGEKACGFLCGAAELRGWPKYDLLAVVRDTRAVHGTLDPLLPAFDRSDLVQAVSVGASGLYHAACHTYLYAPREHWAQCLVEAHKSAFFVLRDLYELRTGQSVRTKRDLLPLLDGDERALLACGLSREDGYRAPEEAFARLLRWSGVVMAETAKIP